MKKIFLIVVAVLVLTLFVWTTFFLYGKSQEKPVVYQTVQPLTTDIIKKTVATGKIIPRKEVDIKSRVSGVVEKLYFEPGKIIRKGDQLAKIKIVPDLVAVNNAQANVKRAQINFNNAKKEMERQKQLFEQKVVSEMDYNTFIQRFEISKEDLNNAISNLELLKEGASRSSGQASNIVISTVDGMILDIPVKEGDQIIESNTFNEGTTIATIANMNEMIFEGKVDESEVGKLEVGMDIILAIGAIEKEKFKAQLEYIAPKGVEEEGAIQFEIRAAVQLQEDKFIRSGYSANGDIVLDRRDSVLSIQESLVQFEGDSTFIEIEKSTQNFEKQYVQLGLSDGINIEVLSGLKGNEKIKAGILQENEK